MLNRLSGSISLSSPLSVAGLGGGITCSAKQPRGRVPRSPRAVWIEPHADRTAAVVGAASRAVLLARHNPTVRRICHPCRRRRTLGRCCGSLASDGRHDLNEARRAGIAADNAVDVTLWHHKHRASPTQGECMRARTWACKCASSSSVLVPKLCVRASACA